ncbi:hypothetical protein RUMGNA_02618 [Mediterraneibacter gnavus ATCC 29149]|uniref:Uncharacterized protein n=1 Tax=Mediterraneibacter gnavus (strain ATCC 29149 / DSM 114966 / JCM 6515 / VPI C7-9) TaxID=411470 RepID=A7B4Y2_MEDG7|nr:hypothetical protein RUMGNA_02618 [Mediterraneibacter gnavus ATCC 29149]
MENASKNTKIPNKIERCRDTMSVPNKFFRRNTHG